MHSRMYSISVAVCSASRSSSVDGADAADGCSRAKHSDCPAATPATNAALAPTQSAEVVDELDESLPRPPEPARDPPSALRGCHAPEGVYPCRKKSVCVVKAARACGYELGASSGVQGPCLNGTVRPRGSFVKASAGQLAPRAQVQRTIGNLPRATRGTIVYTRTARPGAQLQLDLFQEFQD
jgi:hypothetical protein